jgi:hypothetical protein
MHCSRAYFFFFRWNPRGKSFQEGKKCILWNMPKKNAAVYAAERLMFLFHFFKAQNPRLINESGFKLRAAYDGARTVASLPY